MPKKYKVLICYLTFIVWTNKILYIKNTFIANEN